MSPRESARALVRRAEVKGVCGFALLLCAACGAEPRALPEPDAQPTPAAASCPSGPVPAAYAPGVDAELEAPSAWIAAADDAIVLDADALARLRDRDRGTPGFARDPWDTGPTRELLLADAVRMIEGWAREGREGELRIADPAAISNARAFAMGAQPTDHARLIAAPTQLYCAPLDVPLLRPPFDPAFDRNLCTALHPGELVRVLARADGGRWLLVDAGHTVGWSHPSGLSERLAEDERVAWRAGERVWSLGDDVRTRGGVSVPLGVGLPIVAVDDDGIRVRIANTDGPALDVIARDAAVSVGFAPLRRDAVLAVVLATIGARYGWGGQGGGRDCSQLLRDVLVPFGVNLPRHSSLQARAGSRTIELAAMTPAEKLAAIAAAAQGGLVLLYMPGHIMLDLGERDGRRWAISAISEYLEPCPNGGDTLRRLDRVAITDLELGRGSARGAFIERITMLAVLGGDG